MRLQPSNLAGPANRLAGPGLALSSALTVQFGAAITVPVMLVHGAIGITAMRLGCAAVMMLLLARPDFRRFDRRQWIGAVALGLTIALMTQCYFQAVTRIPIGAGITIDFLGPLAVALVALKGWSRIVLPLLAAAGVAAITLTPTGLAFSSVGVAFALASAATWACYILLMQRLGRLFTGYDGLATVFLIAAVAALPTAYVIAPHEISWGVLPVSAGLAILTPFIPFSLEMMALRRMDIGTFSILMSLEPAFGTVFGFLILRQMLDLQQIMGIAAVMTASISAVYLTSIRRPSDGRSGVTSEDCLAMP